MREIFEIAGMKIIQNESIVKISHMQRLPNQLVKKIRNKIMISMNNLKEQNTLMSSL